MLQPFQSHAEQWISRHEKAEEEYSQRILAAESPSSQSNLERFIRTAASAKPPIVLPSFAQESLQRTCPHNSLAEEEYGGVSLELEHMAQSAQVPLGTAKLIPLPPAYINGDTSFERHDPQTVHAKFETITNTFIGIGGHLYQLREVIDYWLPRDSPAILELARVKWWPSQLIEQARLRTIYEINSIQISFTENLQLVNSAICNLREGTFGGRLNTKTLAGAKEMFAILRDFRKLVLKIQRPASDRSRSLMATSAWFSKEVLGPFKENLQEPYQSERFDQNDPDQAHLGELFSQHSMALTATIKFLSNAYEHLSQIFKTIDGICKTMIEGIHKLMLDVHFGQTTGEYIASWANRWERVTFALLLRVLGLPAINLGITRDFPTMEVEYFIPE
ncbi:hypothetical protein MJO28_017777 [Puccinia striiformis f. sp. tritici]|uniref:Uncharacterized protein n=2 Tax=Puccinia striiformis TaxID=27350 RepID=A0A0L0VYZ1_9BASI|nr:hypothetical protein Pst134EB_033091 [Puccinia striiformis f. sp. tritici]KAI7933191.1 hypothetical protein MJO28_017777 [Puccinia striiformis f. sp. tritici]KAI7945416.1 hypothetical protein MJO29_011804 [Puccinia striiformis f. sp. tritici]KNF04458.1 hypothetical protein PSTG_02373 [Puccinia striiformis f. sp. tritici PST-78]